MMEVLLQVRGLQKTYAAPRQFFGGVDAKVQAVAGIDLDISRGESVGLVGESGCGKTTVGRSILRLIEPTAGAIHYYASRAAIAGSALEPYATADLADAARVRIDVRQLRGRALRALRRHVQIVFQDPYASLNPRLSIGQAIGEPLQVHGIARGARREERVAHLLERVGLAAEHAGRYPHEFSGGQRQRIGIARALAVEPRFLVLDEAVSALDVSVQAQILCLLQELQRDLGLSYLFIAHDLAVVKHMTQRVAVMYLGRIVESGPSAAVLDRARHPYTQALLEAAPRLDRSPADAHVPLQGEPPSPLAPPPGCPFHPRCARAQALCAQELPALEACAPGHQVACHFADREE